MPRVNGVYELPPGTYGVSGETVKSAPYNTVLDDLKNDNNGARPETAGGTGATSAVGGADNLSTTGTDIASSTTTNLAAATGVNVTITGTTTITGFGTAPAGVKRWLTFAAALTLTHDGTKLILPSAANITTAAGDTCVALSLGSGNWRVVSYSPASGKAITAPAASDLLAAIKTADGSGSGLDADLLDGQHGSYYLDAANMTGTIARQRMPTNVNANDTSPLIADADNLFVAGAYRTAGTWTGSVFPGTSGNNQGYLRVSAWAGAGAGEELQEWFSINPAIPPYHRRFSAGVATSWVPILDSNSSLSAAKLTGTIPAATFSDTAHGARAGGSLHATASTGAHGFMSASDKEKLDYHSINDHELKSKGSVYSNGGASWLYTNGNVYGDVWGGYLSAYLTATFAQFSTSSSASETSFPIGQTLLTEANASAISVGASVAVYNNSGVISLSSGSALAGTWRVRGRTTTVGGQWGYLMQRVA